ncbi:MAG: hypothetical protein WBE48_23045, partial [Xanthobacteraceae bacterium]
MPFVCCFLDQAEAVASSLYVIWAERPHVAGHLESIDAGSSAVFSGSLPFIHADQQERLQEADGHPAAVRRGPAGPTAAKLSFVGLNGAFGKPSTAS